MVAAQNSSIFENQYWLKMLGNNTWFTLNALSPNETEEIEKVLIYILNILTKL